MKNRSLVNNKGFSLIEVLVAVIVFSFGLLGIAGMMTISVRNNHNGYLRTQANFMAENMMDRMRANPTALWNGDYDGVAADGSQECNSANPCDYAELAAYDTQNWAVSLADYLPNGEGEIVCDPGGTLPAIIAAADPPSIWFPAPPYDGICTITIDWSESDRDSNATVQTLSLVGQP